MPVELPVNRFFSISLRCENRRFSARRAVADAVGDEAVAQGIGDRDVPDARDVVVFHAVTHAVPEADAVAAIGRLVWPGTNAIADDTVVVCPLQGDAEQHVIDGIAFDHVVATAVDQQTRIDGVVRASRAGNVESTQACAARP